MSIRLLSLEEVKKSINMHQAINTMENAFIQLANKKTIAPLRSHLPISKENAITLTMPAYLVEEESLGLKIVSVFPGNLQKNKPTITGCIILLDASTGEPKAIMDAAFLTSLRTGAISGLATKYFSVDDASHVAIIGSGTQAFTQLEAISIVRPIKHVSVWSRNKTNAKKFANKFENLYETKAHDSIEEAVRHADIICTATSSTKPFIHLNNIQPYVHINAIGSHSIHMQEIGADVLSKAIVIADQLQAVLAESGEIIQAIEKKQLNQKSIIEIGSWLLDKNKNYKNCLTVFKSVGLAIQDISIAKAVYQNAIKNNFGTLFQLD